jgi:hypothetical protein
MIKTSDHGQIFLDYVIEHHRFYLDVSFSQKRPLKNELSVNWFLAKRDPDINILFSEVQGLQFSNVPIPMTLFQILIIPIVRRPAP